MNTFLWQTPWKTEGQWDSGLSVIAAERLTKQSAITVAQGAFVGEGENTGNTLVRSPPDTGGQALDAVQTDDVGRFDVYNEGYTEATAWLAPNEVILGLDRDDTGALDTANELFNCVNTPFLWTVRSERKPASCKRSHRANVGKTCQVSKISKLNINKLQYIFILIAQLDIKNIAIWIK